MSKEAARAAPERPPVTAEDLELLATSDTEPGLFNAAGSADLKGVPEPANV